MSDTITTVLNLLISFCPFSNPNPVRIPNGVYPRQLDSHSHLSIISPLTLIFTRSLLPDSDSTAYSHLDYIYCTIHLLPP